MRTRAYRCYACLNDGGTFGREFIVQFEDSTPRVKLPNEKEPGPAVSCPNCGMSNLHPSLGGNVVPLVVLHYEPPMTEAMFGRAGRGTLACDPTQKVNATPETMATGEPLAVRCPRCQETAEFKQRNSLGIHPAFDVPLVPAADGTPAKVPEPHKYQKPTDPTKPPEVLEDA